MTAALVWLMGFLAVLAALIFMVLILSWWRYRKTTGQQNNKTHQNWLIIYASQSGHAQRIAQQTAAYLSANVQDIAGLSITQLQRYSWVLWVVSTYGSGEPPDAARKFARQVMMRKDIQLAQMQFGVLALGDDHYPDFAAFGIQLAQWLEQCGAHTIFPVITVNRMAAAQLTAWYQAIAGVNHLSTAELSAAHTLVQQGWHALKLVRCEWVNPLDREYPVYRLQLKQAGLDWQPGDTLEIQCGSPEVVRTYSICSLPAQSHIELLVRQHRTPAGLGQGSGWLTVQAIAEQEIPVRICTNSRFHLPEYNVPIIFVANGTGLAGIASLLQQRMQQSVVEPNRNWLIWGERYSEADMYCLPWVDSWQKSGILSRCDTVFSRDGATLRYVQDVLLSHPAQVRQWIDEGAFVYVCGSQSGMAKAVEQAFGQILGNELLEALKESQRYRQDIYG